MIKPAVLDAMVAAGCTAEQIAAAVKADQAAGSGAARQARYRARKASQSDERDVTGVTVTDAVSPKKEIPPTPPKEKTTPSAALLSRDPLQGRESEMLAALRITDETKLPGLLILSEPYHWVTNGCDIDLDILPTLRSFGAKGKPIKSWGYCTAAVFEARDKRLAPGPAVQQRQATGPPSPASEPTTGNIWTREASDLGYFDEFASPKTQRNAHGDRTGNRGRAFPTIDVAVQKN